MPPKGSKRQPALSEAHAKATGLSFINSFFKAVDPPRSDTQIPLKKRGRPPKVARSGRPQQAQSPTAASATTPAAGEQRSAFQRQRFRRVLMLFQPRRLGRA